MSSQKRPTNEYLNRLAEKLVKYFPEHDAPEEFRDIRGIDFKTADLPTTLEFLETHPDFQQKAADLVDYSPNRWLLAQEIPVVRERRRIHDQPAAPFDPEKDDPYEWAREKKLQGICFSGGGIRSATLNLGVLQGLAKLEILNHFDYLSSVSGGGYIHEWFAAWIKKGRTCPWQSTAEPRGGP
jgi:hypothetical protein